LQSDHYSFIVRIWRESEDLENDGAMWRGSIDDVSSNKRLYFNDLDGITRFIEEQVGNMADHSRLRWTTRLADKGEYLLSQVQKMFAPLQTRNRHGKQ
jgi:hypothetical protein